MESETIERMVYSIPQVAEKLGVSTSTAYTLAKRADFPSFHISPHRIAVSRVGLERWVEQQLSRKDGEN